MILAHIAGIPVEESVLQFVPAGAAMLAAIAIASRASLRQLVAGVTAERRHRHRSRDVSTSTRS